MATDTEELVLAISADTRQIMNAMKKLTGEIDRSTAGIRKRFETVGKGIDSAMTTAMQERIDAMVGIGTQSTKEWTGALAEQGKELERMRARFSPVFSVISRYKTTLTEIRAAHRLGALSSEEMAAAIQRERQAALASIAAIKQRNAVLVDSPNVFGGVNNFNTANIAAQLQDIAVMAQMGIANPMTIALQQGTQLAAVFNQMGSTRDVIRGLGSAFLSIINPISLVTVGTIAAGVAAYNYFSDAEEGAEATEKALKAQEELIQRVAQAWGDVLPAIRAVAAERERLAGKADIEESIRQRIGEVFKDIGQEVSAAGDEVTDLMDRLVNTTPPDQLVAWQGAIRAVSSSAAENKTTVEQMTAAQKAALDLYASTGIPVFKETADAIDLMLPRLEEARAQIANLEESQATADAINNLKAAIDGISSEKARDELGALLEQVRKGEISVDDLLKKLAEVSSYAPDVSGIISAFRAVAEQISAAAEAAASFTGKASTGGRARYQPGYLNLPETAPTPDRRVDPYFQDWRTGGSGRSKEVTEAERAKKAIDDVIASLKFEQEQLGRTGTEQRIYNELKRAGVDLNSEAGQKIASMVTALEAERQAMERAKKAAEERNQAIGNLFDMGEDALLAMLDNSQKAEDAIKRLAIQLALAAAQAALLGSGPLAGLFGGGGGLLSFLGGGKGGSGGIPWADDLFRTSASIPVPQMPAMQVAANSNEVRPLVVQVDVTGARGNAEIMEMVESGVSRGLGEYDKGRKARLASDLPDLRRRGAI